MDQYVTQLQYVEQALQADHGEEERKELMALRDSLMELISLTQYDIEQVQTDNEDGQDEVDNEMERFMNEINELSTDDVQHIKEKYEQMIGKKCSAPHRHTWDAVAYHNAIICGLVDKGYIDDKGKPEVRFRILFTNPTHKEMLPCSFFLDGNCRFDEGGCHFSHGELVSAADVRDYTEPDFSRLSRNCLVLAKMEDRLWHRGTVMCVNFVEKQCRVRLDQKTSNSQEMEFPFEKLLPLPRTEESDDSTSGSDGDDVDDCVEEEEWLKNSKNCSELFTYKHSQPLGDWEKHTRGIGSKLMAKMGYIFGTGLGSNGAGIVTPVTAQILPPGRSLDHCMELREAANGDKDLFSAEKKMERQHKKQKAISMKAYELESKRTDFFSFLNDNILATRKKTGESAVSNKKSLQEHSAKSLNVESVRVADDIRRKEREIAELQKSLKRNVTGGFQVCSLIQKTLDLKTAELKELQKQQKCVFHEQVSRRTKETFYVF